MPRFQRFKNYSQNLAEKTRKLAIARFRENRYWERRRPGGSSVGKQKRWDLNSAGSRARFSVRPFPWPLVSFTLLLSSASAELSKGKFTG
jgi:hypothetical protein